MTKEKIIKKMTVMDFVAWLIICSVKTLFLIIIGISLLVPYLNIFFFRKWDGIDEGLSAFTNDLKWDDCKSTFKVKKTYNEKLVKIK